MEHIAPLTPDSPRTALPAPPRAPGTHAPSSGPCFSSSRDVAIHQLSASLVTVTFFACFRLGCLYLSLPSSYSPFFYLLLGLGFLQIAYQGCSTEWGRKEAQSNALISPPQMTLSPLQNLGSSRKRLIVTCRGT